MHVPDPHTKPLLTATETAEILGCSLSAVYRMIRSDELPTITLGGKKSTRIVTAKLRRDVLGMREADDE